MMKITKKDFLRRILVQVVFIVVLYGVASLLMGTGVINDYVGQIMITSTVFAIMALGINLVTGMTGQLLLGQAGFMAIGGYAAAILLKNGVPMLPALLAAALIAALLGLLVGIPLFRLRGDYLAIVTLALGEIIVVVLNNLGDLTGGASGLMGIRGIVTMAVPHSKLITFLWVSLFLVLSLLAVVHLMTSTHGRAILSVREDEIAAESMGINTHYTKVFAYAISTFLAGLAGALFATESGYLNPSQFNFLSSVNYLVIVVFGGLGSITGTVLSGYLLTMLQETVLRNLPTVPIFGFQLALADYRLVIYPLLLILMMIFRPQGLLGTRELPLLKMSHGSWWSHTLQRWGDWWKARLNGPRKGN